jgi:hypothetical protein
MPLSPRLPWEKANPLWAATINPVLANPPNNSILLTGISLNNGATQINHGLGRTPQGWVIVDVNASASIYRSQPLNATTLTLTSNAVCVVNIEVF